MDTRRRTTQGIAELYGHQSNVNQYQDDKDRFDQDVRDIERLTGKLYTDYIQRVKGSKAFVEFSMLLAVCAKERLGWMMSDEQLAEYINMSRIGMLDAIKRHRRKHGQV